MFTKKNWLIFSKKEEGKSYFSELLWYEDSLYYRTGLYQTWGTSEKFEFKNKADLMEKKQSIKNEILQSGFKLERKWSFNPTKFDFELFSKEIELALSKSFKLAKKKEKNINAVCLATDDSAMTIFPVYNVFESIEKTDDEELWDVNNWKLWKFDFGCFEMVYRLLLSRMRDGFSDEYIIDFYGKFSKACIQAIKKLKIKDSVILFTSTEDLIDIETCKELNTNELTKRYIKYRKSF